MENHHQWKSYNKLELSSPSPKSGPLRPKPKPKAFPNPSPRVWGDTKITWATTPPHHQ